MNEMYTKEMKVLNSRDKLQLGFLTHIPPKEEGLDSLSLYLGELETLPDLESSIIRDTMVNIVLNKVCQLKTIPRDQHYHFQDRSLKLLAQWNETLAKDGSEKSTAKNDSNKPGPSTPTPPKPVFSFAPQASSDISANDSQSATPPPATGLPAFEVTSSQTIQPNVSSNDLNGSPKASSSSFDPPLASSDYPNATSPTSSLIQTPTPSSSAASTPPTQTITTPGSVSCSFPAPSWGHREIASTTTNTPNTNNEVSQSSTFGKQPPQSHNPFGDPSKPASSISSSVPLPLPKPSDNFPSTPKPKQPDSSLPSTPPPPAASWFFTLAKPNAWPQRDAFSPSWTDCPGTNAHDTICAFSERGGPGEIFYYQNVTFNGFLSGFSQEECRLADYDAGRRFGKVLDI